jgi:hypothetical protein
MIGRWYLVAEPGHRSHPQLTQMSPEYVRYRVQYYLLNPPESNHSMPRMRPQSRRNQSQNDGISSKNLNRKQPPGHRLLCHRLLLQPLFQCQRYHVPHPNGLYHMNPPTMRSLIGKNSARPRSMWNGCTNFARSGRYPTRPQRRLRATLMPSENSRASK